MIVQSHDHSMMNNLKAMSALASSVLVVLLEDPHTSVLRQAF